MTNKQAHGNARGHPWSARGLRIDKATNAFKGCPLLVERAVTCLQLQSHVPFGVPRASCPTAHWSMVSLDSMGLPFNTGIESFDEREEEHEFINEDGEIIWEQWTGPAFDDGTAAVRDVRHQYLTSTLWPSLPSMG